MSKIGRIKLFLFSILFITSVSSMANTRSTQPILFLHGNGDSAALWYTTLWRFESQGYPSEALFAMDFINPSSPTKDTEDEPNRSTTTEQVEQLKPMVKAILQKTGAEKIILIASSRGGNTIRNYIKYGDGAQYVSQAILCGTPNHGVWLSPDRLIDSEWNGQGPFLSALNSPNEVYEGVKFATISSDRLDKYAQPTSIFYGLKGPGYEGSHLKGANNIVINDLDHREVAFHAKAFAEIYRLVIGKPIQNDKITKETSPRLSGIISGFENSRATNIGLNDASIAIYKVDPATGKRVNTEPVFQQTTEMGLWGPFTANSNDYYEFEVIAEGYPVTHYFKSPFLRSSRYINWRLQPIPEESAEAESLTLLSRPRGYFGRDRDTVLVNGSIPENLPAGIPTVARLIFPSKQASARIHFQFNDEVIVARSFAREDNHLSVIELHY